MLIRDIAPGDWGQWAPLWQGYQEFYQVALAEAVSETTWAQFFNEAEPVHALVAEENGALLGMVHYLFHRSTWFVNEVCYLQDLFTSPAARCKGVARALIEAVYAKAQAAGAPRVYWMTQENNHSAQVLYDRVAAKSGFIQYRKNF